MSIDASSGRASGDEHPITHDITPPITIQAQEQAQFNLALAHQSGLGAEVHLPKAIHWYGLAFEQGNLAAHYNLGHLWMMSPDQYTTDAHAGAPWFRAKAEAGDAVAQWVMGLCMEYGQGGARQDAVEAVRWYQMSAAQDFGPALCNLADKYEHGTGVAQDKDKADSLYQDAADNNAAIEYYGLGQLYQNARGAGQAAAQALASYKKAEKADDEWRGVEVIQALRKMPGGEFELAKALLAQCDAARNNKAAVMPKGELIWQQANDIYEPEDTDTMPLAFALYMHAAELGHSEAQLQVALRYWRGLGVSQDSTLAENWYRKSADQGYVEATLNLAELYETQNDIHHDAAKAREWYQKAAMQGDWRAEFKLGLRDRPEPSPEEMGIIFRPTKSATQDTFESRHGALIAESRKSPGLAIASTLLLAVPIFVMFLSGSGGIIAGLLLLAFNTVILMESYQHRVKLYEHALERSGLFGTKTVSIGPGTQCYFRSVSESISGVRTGSYLYIVIDDGKVRLKLSPLLDSAKNLQAHLMAAENQHFLPLARQAYREDKSLDFQVLRLQLGKLFLKNKVLALADIKSMKITNGQLIIHSHQSRFAFLKVPLERIPNMQTLFRLLLAYSTVDSLSA